MHKPESRKTMIVPITAAPGPRPPKGKFFRAPTGFGVGAKGGAKKGVRAGGHAWTKKLGRAVAMPREDGGDHHHFAFGLLYLFTLLLYARPNDLIPAMGTFPLAKIVAMLAPLAYVYAQYKVGQPIIKWTIEVKMVIVMLFLGVI